MGTFRKLHAKVKESKRTGGSADNVFKPDWFAYERMANFLHSIYSSRETQSSEDQSEDTYDDDIQDETSSNVDVEHTRTSISENPTNAPNSDNFKAPGISKNLDKKIRKIDKAEKDKRADEAYNFLAAMRDKPVDDEFSLFSELLCQKLRALEKNTRDIAMHEIDCLMFRFKQQSSLQVTSSTARIQQFQFAYSTSPHGHPQPSPAFTLFPHSHSQPSPGFPPSHHIYSQSSPAFPSSPHSNSQPSPGFPPYQHTHSQSFPVFPSSPHSHSQPSPRFPPSQHSHSQSSPGFPPSPHIHSQSSSVFSPSPQFRPDIYNNISAEPLGETLDSIMQE